jgi:hypothetical protein
MHTVTSFHGSSVPSEQLSALLTEYMALDHARIYRRLLVTRFGVLAFAVGMIGFGFHWLPLVASWVSVAVCTLAPTWAWVAELQCDWRLAKRLSELPDGTTHVVVPPEA